MDRLTAIQVFIEVAESKSFSKASERLNMSRSMATRYVDELENWVGIRLLQRSTRNVALTLQGETYLTECRKIQEVVLGIEMSSPQKNSTPKGIVRVATSLSFAKANFEKLTKTFLELHPEVSIDFIATDHIDNLVEKQIDFAIRITNSLDLGLVAKKIGICRSVLVASKEYLKKNKIPKDPESLQNHQLLVPIQLRAKPIVMTKLKQKQEIAFASNIGSNDAVIILEAVFAHHGIAMLPYYLVDREIKEGKLVEVLPDWKLPEHSIYIAFTSKKYISPAVRAYIDFLTENVSKFNL